MSEPVKPVTPGYVMALIIALWFIAQFAYFNPIYYATERIEAMHPCSQPAPPTVAKETK